MCWPPPPISRSLTRACRFHDPADGVYHEAGLVELYVMTAPLRDDLSPVRRAARASPIAGVGHSCVGGQIVVLSQTSLFTLPCCSGGVLTACASDFTPGTRIIQ
jgi:hypothetical protein